MLALIELYSRGYSALPAVCVGELRLLDLRLLDGPAVVGLGRERARGVVGRLVDVPEIEVELFGLGPVTGRSSASGVRVGSRNVSGLARARSATNTAP